MPIKLNSAGGGSVSIDVPSTAATYTLTAPAKTATLLTSADSNTVTQTMLATGIAGNGPVFSSYIGSSQTISHNTWTKVQFNGELFDTANCYDSSTNYRFTPNVAGYYQMNLGVDFVPNQSRAYYFLLALYKNGSGFKYSALSLPIASGGQDTLRISSLVSMNGTTDYLETYVYIYDYTAASSVGLTANGTNNEFSGFLARAA